MTGYDPATYWFAVIGLGLVTYLCRLSFLAFLGDRPLPKQVRKLLRLIPAAALTGLIAPAVILHSGEVATLGGKERLVAAGLAVVVALATRSIMATIATGMISLWLLLWQLA